MALTNEQKEQIRAAGRRISASGPRMTREYGGYEFTFQWRPAMLVSTPAILQDIKEFGDSDGVGDLDKLQRTVDFLREMSGDDETRELIDFASSDDVGVLDLPAAQKLMMDVIGVTSGRPFENASSSPGGSSATGEGSTASAPTEESTPPPSQ